MGHIIRASDPRLCMIDFSIPRFLAQKDVVPVELPPQLAFPEVVAPREEIASSRLSLEEEIDQFRLEKRGRSREILSSTYQTQRMSLTGLQVFAPQAL